MTKIKTGISSTEGWKEHFRDNGMTLDLRTTADKLKDKINTLSGSDIPKVKFHSPNETVVENLNGVTVDPTVTIQYVNEFEPLNTRPDEITIKLKANNTIVEEKAFTTNKAKSIEEFSFRDKPKYDSNEEAINYTFEITLPGYTLEYVDGRYKATGPIIKTIKNLKLIFDDEEDKSGIRPSEVEVVIKGNGNEVYRGQVEVESPFEYSYELNKYLDNTGIVTTYTLSVSEIEGYEITDLVVEGDLTTITLFHEATIYENYTFTSQFLDGNNKDGIRPDSLTLFIYKQSVLVETKTITTSTLNFQLEQDLEHPYIFNIEQVSGYTSTLTENNKVISVKLVHDYNFELTVSFNHIDNDDLDVRPNDTTLTITDSDGMQKEELVDFTNETVIELPRTSGGELLEYTYSIATPEASGVLYTATPRTQTSIEELVYDVTYIKSAEFTLNFLAGTLEEYRGENHKQAFTFKLKFIMKNGETTLKEITCNANATSISSTTVSLFGNTNYDIDYITCIDLPSGMEFGYAGNSGNKTIYIHIVYETSNDLAINWEALNDEFDSEVLPIEIMGEITNYDAMLPAETFDTQIDTLQGASIKVTNKRNGTIPHSFGSGSITDFHITKESWNDGMLYDVLDKNSNSIIVDYNMKIGVGSGTVVIQYDYVSQPTSKEYEIRLYCADNINIDEIEPAIQFPITLTLTTVNENWQPTQTNISVTREQLLDVKYVTTELEIPAKNKLRNVTLMAGIPGVEFVAERKEDQEFYEEMFYFEWKMKFNYKVPVTMSASRSDVELPNRLFPITVYIQTNNMDECAVQLFSSVGALQGELLVPNYYGDIYRRKTDIEFPSNFDIKFKDRNNNYISSNDMHIINKQLSTYMISIEYEYTKEETVITQVEVQGDNSVFEVYNTDTMINTNITIDFYNGNKAYSPLNFHIVNWGIPQIVTFDVQNEIVIPGRIEDVANISLGGEYPDTFSQMGFRIHNYTFTGSGIRFEIGR